MRLGGLYNLMNKCEFSPFFFLANVCNFFEGHVDVGGIIGVCLARSYIPLINTFRNIFRKLNTI